MIEEHFYKIKLFTKNLEIKKKKVEKKLINSIMDTSKENGKNGVSDKVVISVKMSRIRI